MLDKNLIGRIFCGASAVMIVGCASVTALPEVPQSEASQTSVPRGGAVRLVNTVCNHQFTSTQLASRPRFTENETNTVISGESARELLRSVKSLVPNDGTGSTKWDLKWSFDTRRGARGCGIGRVETQVVVNYQLPLWPDQLFAINRDLTDQWNRYSDALRAHHCMHGKASIDASIEVKESLQRMSSRSDCSQMQLDADELAKSIVGNYKEIESRFEPPVVTDYIQ